MEISSRLVHNTPLPETGDDLPAAYFSAALELTTLLGALGECDEIPRVVVGLNILICLLRNGSRVPHRYLDMPKDLPKGLDTGKAARPYSPGNDDIS